ncbi:uncharacterized protein NFIA_106900 [Aspergillus fischeri NRRL 181]|uniref:Uncharacterized protein n=1 Tax=Neosartorya fischeri (strain ATCC 1020 / DSM 3700 / CBS 544.65 / FGSC A1164 / JCM 1740 / NRRL 181 / WB 181) TaxID=331117 RepID=A1CX49_NEOFI|nr:conserved hypothetical protein [Aspergillus fischeri NRRL 181]EAW25201.1 conserved hypothetical protein [Aspergillus fischeri NRRL 181]
MDTISPAPSRSGSDTESITSIPPRQNNPKHSKEQSVFPLAHPPPKPTQRLRLTPKLLLQIQHLSPKSNRPLPVLEVWQPSRFAARPCATFPKLHAGDMYITQSEAYASLSGENHNHNPGSEAEADASHEAVVGVIYHPPAQKTKAKKEGPEPAQAEVEVHFPLTGRTWSASVTAGGGYRFQGRDEAGVYVLEWKRRGEKERSRSFSSSSTDRAPGPGADSRFVLGIVDMRTRRGARVASLTKKGFEVGCWERLPLEGLQECVGSSTDESELSEGQFRTAVNTMVLSTGVWVAAQEGWLG